MVLICLYGVGDEIVSGFFPVEEKREAVTLPSRIHGAGSVIGFLALLPTPLLLVILHIQGAGAATGWLYVFIFALTLGAFVLFIMSDKPAFQNTPVSMEGLWQRLVCVFAYIPLIVEVTRYG